MCRLRLLAVGLVCFCAGGLYGWSALIAPLQATFSVSAAQAGLVFSFAIVSFTAAVVVAPRIAPGWPALYRLALFAWAGALSLSLAPLSPTYFAFVLGFGVGFGAASGAIYITAIAYAARSRRPLVATPLMVATFGLGGSVFGPVWKGLATANWGLSAIWPLAGMLCFAGCLAWYLAGPDTGSDTIPLVKPPQSTPAMPQKPVFGLLWLTFAFGSFGGLMVLGLAAKMLETAQASVVLISLALAGVSVGNTLGRASVAGLAHRMSPFACIHVSLTFGTCGLIFALLGSGSASMTAGLCLVAAGYGVMASAIPSLTRTLYHPEHFQRQFALLLTAWGAAGFLAPWTAGALFDLTGNFDTAVLMAIGTTFACAAALQKLKARVARVEKRPE